MQIEDKELSKVANIIIKNIFPQKIFLFGSRAVNAADNKSDYDIFVLVKNKKGKNTREMEKELYYLMAKEGVGIPVDLIVETEEKFERLKDNQYLIYNQVDKYGKTIYERETPIPAMA
jgi:predicted nucleotidyltransferase